MRRSLFLLLVVVLSCSIALVAFAQDDAPGGDPNACLPGGSMEGKCDFPTAAEVEWAWTCGYYVGLYDDGEISRDQIPDWCYYPEGGEVLGIISCFTYESVDFRIVGPVNTANNVIAYGSMDGSCSGPQYAMGTLVEAPDLTSATALCISLTTYPYSVSYPLDPALVGRPNYWGCSVPV